MVPISRFPFRGDVLYGHFTSPTPSMSPRGIFNNRVGGSRWGWVLQIRSRAIQTNFPLPQRRAAACTDDGFMHDDLLTVLRMLSALKRAFKVDLGMELTLHKCKVLIPR